MGVGIFFRLWNINSCQALFLVAFLSLTLVACSSQPDDSDKEPTDNSEPAGNAPGDSGDDDTGSSPGVPANINLVLAVSSQLINDTDNCIYTDNTLSAMVQVYLGDIHNSVSDPAVLPVQTVPVEETATGEYQYQLSFDQPGQYSLYLHCESQTLPSVHPSESQLLLTHAFVLHNTEKLSTGDLVLPGSHIETTVECESCHFVNESQRIALLEYAVSEIVQCSICHDGIAAAGKTDGHVPTQMPCRQCHDTQSWTIQGLDHEQVTAIACIECHNGIVASGKWINHIPTDDECQACHDPAPATWAPVSAANVDHAHVIGSCSDCHCGSVNVGTGCGGPDHPQTDADCGACHSTNVWLPLVPDHSLLVDNCIACHDGESASGKSPNHILTTDVCEACHEPAPTPWTPLASANVNHNEILSANCTSCHQCVVPINCPPEPHPPYIDDCAACHQPPAWLPTQVDHALTTTDCVVCHNGVDASGKSGTHIYTTDVCEACHEPANPYWAPVGPGDVDHNQVIGSCASCHICVIGPCGIPVDHPASDDDCGACHAPPAWLPLQVNHTLTTSACTVCHNGIDASGKSAAHINSTDQCQTCHEATFYWAPVSSADVDHNEVIGSCVSCHDGCIGTCPPHPINTTANCAACHNVDSWIPVNTVDHNEVLGDCSDCHDGVVTTGKPDGHIATNFECSVCHTTSNWTVN